MDAKIFDRSFRPLLLIFIIVTVLLIVVTLLLPVWNVNPYVMIAGNLILFTATSFSFKLYRRSLENNNVQAFLRMIYGGMFARMMICLFSALIYIAIAGKKTDKGAIFGFMFLYFLYTFTEIWIIMKLSKQKKHA